jgi:hypothetical protein
MEGREAHYADMDSKAERLLLMPRAARLHMRRKRKTSTKRSELRRAG